MKKYKVQTFYCLIQFFIWGLYGVLLSYSHVYLLSFGLSNTVVSVAMAIASIFAVALQAGLTELSVRRKNLTAAALLAGLGGLLAFCCAALLLPVKGIWLIVGLFALAAVCNQILPGFANAMGTDCARQGYAVNFSMARGVGSAAFSLCTLLVGGLLERVALWLIPLVSGVFGAGLLLFTTIFARLTPGKEPMEEKAEKSLGFFQETPWFILFLAGCVCLFLSHQTLGNYMYQITVYKGGGKAEQGMIQSLAAILELPVMFGFGLLLKKRPCGWWLRLSPLFFVLRSLGMLLAPNAHWLLAAQLLHPMGFALYTVASVAFAAEALPARHALQGQSYLFAASSVGSILSLLLGGPLLDRFSAQSLLLTAVLFGAVGYVIFQWSIGKKEAGK